jgi:hypothetical protein
MGPVSGYNLDGLPNSWDESIKLRSILKMLWHTMCQHCDSSLLQS